MFLLKIKYYIDFIRIYAFLGMFVVSFCASLIATNYLSVKYNIFLIILGAISCGLLASAAYGLNNIFDLEIDKINKPFRPLPAKKISLKEAWGITVLFYLFSIFFSFFINISFFILILIMTILTILYSAPPFIFKKNSILGILILALLRGLFIFLAGWSLVASLRFLLPWYISLIIFLFLLGATSTKDIFDKKGDKKNKHFTLPLKYSFDFFIVIIAPFFIFPFLLIPIGIYFGILKVTTWPLSLLFIYGIYIIFLLKKYPKKKTKIESNHIAWKHSYILYMLFNLGVLLAYVV